MTPLRDVVTSDVERACNRGLLSGGSGRDMVRYTELAPDRFKNFWRD
jgi:hypothetical protein